MKENIEGEKVLYIWQDRHLSIGTVEEDKWIKIREPGKEFHVVYLEGERGYRNREEVWTLSEIKELFEE